MGMGKMVLLYDLLKMRVFEPKMWNWWLI